jgi:predicted DNA-binding transcriptional regulator YafY
VPNTAELRWWLLGFGGNLKVLAPIKLRNEITNELKRALGRYSDD